ncbi:MAG: lysophospholipase, partial [Anaeroplasmataceae bacterium]|nr:lysophospholipase [Anaeroplasmataceae bacterium]
MWGSHCAYVQEIERLAKDGFKVLGVDAYGTELSDGKSILGLGNSLLTLDYTLSFVKRNYPNEAIYVMGHSWGGFAACNIAKYHKVEKIVAMSPFISVFKTFKLLLPKLLYPTLPFLMLIDTLKCGKYNLANTKKTLKSTQVNTLVLHSLDDPMLPFEKTTGRIQKKNINPHVCFHIVDGKKHNPDYSYEALSYTEEAFKKLKSIDSVEEKLAYKKGLDYHKMGELDEKVFDVILDFLNS